VHYSSATILAPVDLWGYNTQVLLRTRERANAHEALIKNRAHDGCLEGLRVPTLGLPGGLAPTVQGYQVLQ
jgi:hypothetical protein